MEGALGLEAAAVARGVWKGPGAGGEAGMLAAPERTTKGVSGSVAMLMGERNVAGGCSEVSEPCERWGRSGRGRR